MWLARLQCVWRGGCLWGLICKWDTEQLLNKLGGNAGLESGPGRPGAELFKQSGRQVVLYSVQVSFAINELIKAHEKAVYW